MTDDVGQTASEQALTEETLQVGIRKAAWEAISDAGEQAGVRIAGEQAHAMADIAARRLTHVFNFQWRPGSRMERSIRLGLIAKSLVGLSKDDAVRIATEAGAEVAVRDDPDGWYTDEYVHNRITITALQGTVTHALDG